MSRMFRAARTAVVALVLCAAGAGPGLTAAYASGPQHRGPVRTLPARTPARPDVLRVTTDDGHGHVGAGVLRCHPASGSVRQAAAACRRLDELGGPLGPSPKREMCSMVYAGPQTARITGTWRGRHVDETYGRDNGCRTSRWERMRPVLPTAPAGGAARWRS